MRVRWAALAAAGALAGCTTVDAPACRADEKAAVAESLYFGTAMPGGRVRDEDWQRFVADAIAPRFPEGFTAWAAMGQWRNAAGEVQQEGAYVLRLVHASEAKYDAALRDVIADYKSRFQQEAVLRVRTSACMSY